METDFVRVAKRENNNKRKYLVVNRFQGKHVPAAPSKTLEMFDCLAEKVTKEYKNEKILLIGFAETATAIGARLAVKTGFSYIQTTREDIYDVEYLYFTESHSHATEQKLVKTDLDKVIDKINRIVFVEDEITTGNTILKIIKIIKNIYSDKLRFSVASILNGMDKNSINKYDLLDIRIHYLLKTDHSGYGQIADNYRGDGKYYPVSCKDGNINVKEYEVNGYINARRLTSGDVYKNACEFLWSRIKEQINVDKKGTMLIIGTEEFMYPAIYVAYMFEKSGFNVKCHSTTRSPIEVSTEEEYPLHTRFELYSVYDDNRQTFIYDLDKYDKVVIITDSANESEKGINSLINATVKCKNTDVTLVRWCE